VGIRSELFCSEGRIFWGLEALGDHVNEETNCSLPKKEITE